jgi:kynurenine 3-monooxygenase
MGYLLETDMYPWSMGKCLLVGDSSHSMLPFFGLGLNTTLDDMLSLEHFLEETNNDFEKAF